MGTIFKKTVTRPLPTNATVAERRRRATAKELGRNPNQTTIVETVAKWRDKKGDSKSAVVVIAADGSQRIRVKSATYYAQYRDGDKLKQFVPTGCRDSEAAKSVLAELERRAERVTAGVVTSAENETVDQQTAPIAKQVADYLESLRVKRGKGKRLRVAPRHVQNVERVLSRIVSECGFRSLREINAEAVRKWVAQLLDDSKCEWSPRTINAHLSAIKAFCNWATTTKPRRLQANTLERFAMLDESTNPIRARRSMTPTELQNLLTVARMRPLAEFGRKTKRKTADEQPTNATSRKTWTKEPLTLPGLAEAYRRGRDALKRSPGKIVELERKGRERALIYKTLVLTGLRFGELTSLTVGDLQLDLSPAWLTVKPENEKAGQGAELPIRDDLAIELRAWVADRRQWACGESESVSIVVAADPLPLSTLLFDVPTGLIRVLDRDLSACGILKRDDRGRTLDVHALRHTFCTLLSRAGVAPRTAQQAMRHSSIELTMQRYTDPALLDVAGAVDCLPALSLDTFAPETIREIMRATGTDGATSFVAPTVAPNPDNGATIVSICDNLASNLRDAKTIENNEKPPVFQGFSLERVTGFEPATYSLGSCHSAN